MANQTILNSRLSTRCAILLPRVDFSSTSEPQNLQRLSKLIADRVAISRREAERLIRAGDVTLAGTTVRSPQLLVDWKDLQNSALVVQGKVVTMDSIAEMERKLGAEKDNPNASSLSTTRVWLAHKLAGELVSEDDPYGRPSLLQRLARGGVGKNGKQKLHLKPVGRLDMPTEGLILLTNDGKYARELELPASMIHRVYRVRAHGNINDYKIAQIQRGITIEGVRYSPMKVQLDGGRSEASNKWLKVTCAEGKNRQIRKVFKHLGMDVTRLIRIAYGDYKLQTIPPGMAVEVPYKPIKAQRNRGILFQKRRPKVQEETTELGTEDTSSLVRWVRYL